MAVGTYFIYNLVQDFQAAENITKRSQNGTVNINPNYADF